MSLHPEIIRHHPRKQILAETSGDVEDTPAFLAKKMVMMPPLNQFIAGRSILDKDGNSLMGLHKGPQGAVDRGHTQAPSMLCRNPEDIGGKERPVAGAENILDGLPLDGSSFAVDNFLCAPTLHGTLLAHNPSLEQDI